MEILAELIDFFTQKPTISNKKLERQLDETCRKIEKIDYLMFSRKVIVKIDNLLGRP